MNVAMEGPRNSCARIEKRASHLSVAHTGRAPLSISCWLRVIYHKNTHARTFAGIDIMGAFSRGMSCPNVLSLGVNSELSFGCGYRIQATSARRVGARRSFATLMNLMKRTDRLTRQQRLTDPYLQQRNSQHGFWTGSPL